MDCETIRQRQIADEYRAGRLSPEDADDYEQHFLTCERCLEDLQFRDRVSQCIRAEGADLFAAEIEARRTARARRPEAARRSLGDWLSALFPPRPAWIGALATVAALVVVTLMVNHGMETSARLKDLVNPTAFRYIPSDLRGGAGSEEFLHGMEAYSAGRYDEAAGWLKQSMQAGSRQGEVRFYLGVSLLLSGDASGARGALEEAARITPSSGLYHWYLAQALLKCGNVGAAEKELAQVSATGGEFALQARALLQKIREVKGR